MPTGPSCTQRKCPTPCPVFNIFKTLHPAQDLSRVLRIKEILFMGVKNLPVIAQKLMENGMRADMPCALVHWGTTCRQRNNFV